MAEREAVNFHAAGSNPALGANFLTHNLNYGFFFNVLVYELIYNNHDETFD